MFGRNSRLRMAARHWISQHKTLQGIYMMLKSPEFWREVGAVRKWTFLIRVMPYTMVPYPGLSSLYDMAEEIERKGIAGAFVECGVWRGGCALIMASIAARSGRMSFLFDSFEGLPEPIEKDGARALKHSEGKASGQLKPIGTAVAALDDVKQILFEHFQLNPDKVTLIKGWFQDMLPSTSESLGPIAILRLDGDFYESTKVCLDCLYNHVVAGGIVIIDDYETYDGCRKATDEFLQARGLGALLQRKSTVHFRKPDAVPVAQKVK